MVQIYGCDDLVVGILGERLGEDDADVVVVGAAFDEIGCEDATVGEVVADDVVVAGFGFAVDSELVFGRGVADYASPAALAALALPF